jgi:hypothetical protein
MDVHDGHEASRNPGPSLLFSLSRQAPLLLFSAAVICPSASLTFWSRNMSMQSPIEPYSMLEGDKVSDFDIIPYFFLIYSIY